MADPRKEGRSAALLAALAAVVVLAAVGLVFLRAGPEAADPADHLKAAAALAGTAAPTDVVFVVSPDPSVLAPYHERGLKAVAGTKVPAAATVGFSRVWVVRAPLAGRAPGAGLGADPILARLTPGAPLDGGPGAPEIVPFALAGGGGLGFDFLAEVAKATVKVNLNAGGAPLACPFTKDRHQCPTHKHVWVGPRDLTVAGQPATCLWAHPFRDGVLEITYPAVKAGRELRGRYAFTDRGAAATALPPLSLEVNAGGALQTFSAPRAKGFKDFSIPLSAAPGSAIDVTFKVSTPDSGAAHFCFDAFMVE